MMIKRCRLAVVVCAAMAATAPVMPAQAQAEQTTETRVETRRFNIPAQPLASALVEFGRQAGFQTTADAALVAGKRSAPVAGEMTWRRAIGTLLAGTGNSYRLNGSMVALVDLAADDGAIQLDPIRVEGETSDRSYDASTSVIQGNRLGQTRLETPRSVSVITRSILEDQQPANEVDVLRNVSGVSRVNDFQGTYQRFQLRGIDADNSRTYLRDGYRFPHQSDPALYNIERVEVIKGPNAIDFGQSTPGGFINYVTKKPLDEARYGMELTAGSFDLYKGAIDLTGPLDEGKTLRYRLTAGFESGGAFTDEVDPLRRGVSGAISWDITSSTILNVAGDYQKTERLANPGWPVPDPTRLESADALPDSAFYGDANLEYDLEEYRYSIELLQKLWADWQFRARFGQDKLIRDNNFISLRGLTPDGSETTRRLFQRLDSERDSITARADISGAVDTFGIEHDLVVGADFYRFASTDTPFLNVNLPNVSVFSPQLTATTIPANPNGASTEESSAYGFFVQDSIDLGAGFGLQVGVRHDILKNDETSEEIRRTSPNGALTYAPTQSSLLYFSYSTSFEPNWDVDILGGGVADPSKGEQFEIGYKQGWFDGRLTTTAALFSLTKSNIVVDDPANPGFDVLTGEVEVQGVELEATGELYPGLNILAQVTVLDSEVTEDTDETIVGNQLSGSVQHTASLWATYQLPGDLDSWTLGGGVFYTGKRVLNDSNSLSLPSYTTFDAFLGYRITDTMHAQLNVKNIADKRYYVNASTSGDTFRSTFPGEPRAISLTLRATF